MCRLLSACWGKKKFREGAPLLAQMGKNPPAIRRPGFHPCVPKIPWRRKWKPLQYSCLEKNFMDRGTWGQLQPMGWQRVRPNSATNTFPRKNLLPQPCPNQPPRISVNPPALLQKQHKTKLLEEMLFPRLKYTSTHGTYYAKKAHGNHFKRAQ